MSTFFLQPSQSTYISSLQFDTNFATTNQILVGKNIQNLLAGLLQFDDSMFPNPATINRAILSLNLVEDTFPPSTKTIMLYPISSPWKDNEVTFSTQPPYETTFSAELVTDGQIRNYYKADITEIVKAWFSGGLPNHGLIMFSDDLPLGFAGKNATATTQRIAPLLEIDYLPVIFTNLSEYNLATSDELQYTLLVDTPGVNEISYFVTNTGTNDIAVQLQLSPDGITFMPESPLQVISPGESSILVSRFFIRFIRFAYSSAVPGATSTLNVWYQSQGY